MCHLHSVKISYFILSVHSFPMIVYFQVGLEPTRVEHLTFPHQVQPTNIMLALKIWPDSFFPEAIDAEKSFKTLTPSVNLIKRFCL